jgi:hypothetical protein
MLCMVLDLVADELDRLHGRIAGRFSRAEPRARVRGYVSGLERRNGWTLAEQVGEGTTCKMVKLSQRVIIGIRPRAFRAVASGADVPQRPQAFATSRPGPGLWPKGQPACSAPEAGARHPAVRQGRHASCGFYRCRVM